MNEKAIVTVHQPADMGVTGQILAALAKIIPGAQTRTDENGDLEVYQSTGSPAAS